MRRAVLIALLLALMTPLTALGVNQPVRYYMPGTGENIDPAVIEAGNRKMNEDGLNLELSVHFIPWDDWETEIHAMIDRSQEFELFLIMQDLIPYSTYQGEGSLRPLSELISKFGPALTDLFWSEVWQCATQQNAVYVVPAQWRDASGDMQGLISIRQDKLDGAGLSIDEADLSIDGLIDTLAQLQAAWGEDETPYVWDHSLRRPPVVFHRTYNSWPFYVSWDGLFRVDQDGHASAYFLSEEFKRDCSYYARMYSLGLIHPDILSLPSEVKTAADKSGNLLAGFDTVQEDGEAELKLIIPHLDIKTYRPAPKKPVLMSMPMLNANAVPITARHPEAGIRFLNWLYSRKENHDLLIYGIEGTHYIRTEKRYIKSALNPKTGKMLHRFDYWMIGYNGFALYEEGTPQSVIDDWSDCTSDYVVSPVMGFSFQSEALWQRYARITDAYNQWILPIKLGVVDYDTHIDAAIAAMEDAGIHTLVYEYQRQLDKYRAERYHRP